MDGGVVVDDNTLELAAEHVSYEAKLMLATAARLEEFGIDAFIDYAKSPWVSVLILEGLLLHTRNMLGFLFGAAARNDDILAVHFLPSWDPGRCDFAGPSPKRLPHAELGRLLNKHLSHLTYTRVEEPRPAWRLQLAIDVGRILGRFFRELPPDRAGWFDAEVRIATGGDAPTAGSRSRAWYDVLLERRLLP